MKFTRYFEKTKRDAIDNYAETKKDDQNDLNDSE